MPSRETLRYFRDSFWLTVAGLLAAVPLGYFFKGPSGILQTVFVIVVLSILEISLSFDNAVANAVVLTDMSKKWRGRFLTWGIAVSVFGMRLVFPLLIVAAVARIDPWSALVLAIHDPKQYEFVMSSAHVSISAYGGTFLLMVGLTYFLDKEKKVHWVRRVELTLSYLGRLDALEIGLALLILLIFYKCLPVETAFSFLTSGLWGLLTYIAVERVGIFLNRPSKKKRSLDRASLGMFFYLEVLDASFSFDGVIGAFALTNNLFVMMLGLGIGALYVRNLTVMLVDRKTLGSYRYLEHGAFWAILALAVCMYISVIKPIPEYFTGLLGAAFILLAYWSSVRQNRREAAIKASQNPRR